MGERCYVYIILCFFALHGLVKGYEAEGHNGKKKYQPFTEEPCLSILATDLMTYHGKLILLHKGKVSQFHYANTFQMLEHLL